MCKVRVRVRVQSGSASKLRPRRRRRRARSRTLVLGRSGSCRASLPLGPATPSTGLFLALRARTTVVRICPNCVVRPDSSSFLHSALCDLGPPAAASTSRTCSRTRRTHTPRTLHNAERSVRRAACGVWGRAAYVLKSEERELEP